MVNAGCRDNHSPPHLSPPVDYQVFPPPSSYSILGSDGECDPFDSSSPPVDLDNGNLVIQDTLSYRTGYVGYYRE